MFLLLLEVVRVEFLSAAVVAVEAFLLLQINRFLDYRMLQLAQVVLVLVLVQVQVVAIQDLAI
jgi:hypothetical protein